MTKHKMHGKLMCAHPMHVHILFPMTSLDVDAKPSTPVSPSSTRARVPSVVRDLNWSPATWLLLVVLAGALFLDGLDISMVGVAPARNRPLSIYTMCGASGFSLGLVFGGLLTEIGWRMTFLLPGPVAIAFVLIGFRVIPRVARQPVRLAQLDLAGAFTSTASL